MSATTCAVCRQLVALDAAGIRPHTRRGSPCAGGRAAPVLGPPSPRVSVNERGRAAQAARRAKAKAARVVVAKRPKRARAPDLRRGRYKRVECPHAFARAREALMLSMLPATSYAMAEAAGVTVTHVVRLMLRLGAKHVGLEPVPGGGRSRTIWGKS